MVYSKKMYFFTKLIVIFCTCFALVLSTSMLARAATSASVELLTVLSADDYYGSFREPGGLFYEENSKRFYVADSGNSRLLSFDKNYEYVSELSHADLGMPLGIVKAKSGNFFVMDGKIGALSFIDLKDKTVNRFEFKGVPKGREAFYPGSFAVDGDDNLYIIDRLNKRIIITDAEGNFKNSLVVKGKDFRGFNDVRVDANGIVYALDTVGAALYIFNSKGKMVKKITGKTKDSAFVFPVSIALSPKGYIFVLDSFRNQVLVFSSSGSFNFVFSQPGKIEGRLNSPSYVYIDNEGRLYIVDGNRIQIFKLSNNL
ncbi:MAG: NHL repeat-containing protein [Deltaproteobacteria bacterium]|nr:NHL repeat-containing protein [Deltaproteobacteria bacterium]